MRVKGCVRWGRVGEVFTSSASCVLFRSMYVGMYIYAYAGCKDFPEPGFRA